MSDPIRAQLDWCEWWLASDVLADALRAVLDLCDKPSTGIPPSVIRRAISEKLDIATD
jgi:hypothetical protein